MYGLELHTGRRAVACSRRLTAWLGGATTTRIWYSIRSSETFWHSVGVLPVNWGCFELICIYVSFLSNLFDFTLLVFGWFSIAFLLSLRGLNHGWTMDPVIVYGYGIWMDTLDGTKMGSKSNRSIDMDYFFFFFFWFFFPKLSPFHHINLYSTPLVCPCW